MNSSKSSFLDRVLETKLTKGAGSKETNASDSTSKASAAKEAVAKRVAAKAQAVKEAKEAKAKADAAKAQAVKEAKEAKAKADAARANREKEIEASAAKAKEATAKVEAANDGSATDKDGLDGLFKGEDSSGDLFSNLNRARPKSGSDDFEDLLLGGLNGADDTNTVPSKDPSGHWASSDHDRPTETPARVVPGEDAPEPSDKTDDAIPSADDSNVPPSSNDDITDKIESGIRRPLARRGKKDKTSSPTIGAETTHEDPIGDLPLDTASGAKSKASTGDVINPDVSETPNGDSEPAEEESRENTSKQPANDADNSIRSIRKRAREQLAASEPKKRINAELSAEASQEESLDQAEKMKVTTAPPSPPQKEEPIVVTPEKTVTEDGFELSEAPKPAAKATADINGEVDTRGRAFKVSTETVKQSFFPPARVRARKVRRVIRHIDPWSVLTFSVLFHLTVFSSLLLGSVLIWQVAEASGVIENIESAIQDLGSFSSYELNGWAVFRAAVAVAGIFTLASTIVVVILAVIFNLISDLVGGIRVTVVQEESVRVQRDK